MATASFVNKEKPPDDDVCPVCFGEFVLPCRTNCGHWFCGFCILQVSKFSSSFRACKCPMCCSSIKILKPEASLLLQQHGEEAKKVLKSIERYNRQFVGGARGFLLKFYDFPILLQKIFYEMTDPNHVERHVDSWRLLALILGSSYMISPFKFLPGDVNVMTLSNTVAFVAVIVVKISGVFRRRRSAQRVRRMAAEEPPSAAT